jgi:subtilisin-like proprotein convertase family protein
VLPSDLDGPPPPIGTPNYFSYFTSVAFGDPQDGLRVFQFHTDFVNPNLATFTERAESPIAVAAFTPFSPGTPAIPQSGTTQNLDSLGDRLMHRLQYRNFASNETLVVNHSVNGGSAQAAIRYYQLRRPLPSGNFGVYDQATFAPDALYRWMGSAALDYLGNMAVGYSVSSTTNFPSIRYAGRLASDPTNGLFQGEANLLTGADAQTGASRWGDYSGLTVDPNDDTTFWYTQEYYGSSSPGSWQTRVGRFQIATNSPPAPKGTLQGTVTDISSSLPISNVVVRTTSGFFRVTGASGTYSMTVPPGTYTLFASAPCRGAVTNSGVTVANGGTTTQNFTLNSGGTPLIVANGATLTTESCLATNGAIDPGETVTVSFGLQNTGCGNTANLVATLQATGGVTSPSGPQTYGIVTNGGTTVSRPFTFTASGSCGGTITATLQLQDGLSNLGTITFPFTLGAPSPATNSFANSGLISIPTSGSNGRSTPYPSTITVSALGGLVSKVTVTITNLNHTWPDDISILLVGPAGQTTMLMSDAGGNNGVTPISNTTVTFDDSAATQLPQSTQITSGTYRPGDYDSTETLDTPAPAGPYGTVLSVFNGTNPNGTWSLYVDDDFPPQDGGSIANGWKITIVSTTNSCCTGASNHPPVITAASISPVSPTTTNILTVTGISTNDPDNDPVTLAYQWQQSTNNIAFTNLVGQTASTLGAAITIAGDYYRVTLTPNDGHTNGAPFTTASVLVPFDADGNGINDDWEVQYFGHIGINPNADADGTGQNNLFKYVAGLDPTNPNSVFLLQINAVTNQLKQDNLLFDPLAGGRTYKPQFNTDLVNGTWLPLAGYLGPTTNGNQVTITDTNATPPKEFYRIDISLP